MLCVRPLDPNKKCTHPLAISLDYLQQLTHSVTQTQNGSPTVLLPTENGLQRTTQTGHPFCVSAEGGRKNESLSLHDANRLRPSLSSAAPRPPSPPPAPVAAPGGARPAREVGPQRGAAGAVGSSRRWAQDEALPEWNGCHVFAFIVGEGKIWEKFAPRHCSKVAFATGHQKRLVWPQQTLGCWLQG